eukprot:scaffold20751_cov124-Isochrysis_galbana.AAC.5
MSVGECLVGRHASGMAVERCVVFGVGRVGSVSLPGFCVVGRWIGHHCFTCDFLSLVPPHDDPPSLAGEGDPIPQHKNKHTSHKHVATRQGRHKGAGKGTYTSCSEGGGPLRGGLPIPLSGA